MHVNTYAKEPSSPSPLGSISRARLFSLNRLPRPRASPISILMLIPQVALLFLIYLYVCQYIHELAASLSPLFYPTLGEGCSSIFFILRTRDQLFRHHFIRI